MPETVDTCLLCGSQKSKVLDQRLFRGVKVTNRVCLSCGLVYQSPRMTAEEAGKFYEAEYRQVYQGTENPIKRDFTTQTARARSLLGFIEPCVPTLSSHLDIGCSTGIILQQFKDRYHCQPCGIEPGEAYRAYAREHGLSVYATMEDLEKDKPERFALISMSHVLEHMPDPVAYLAHLREALLDPAGWLLLEVPNLYAHDSFEIAHMVSFSAHTLHQALEKAGYEIIKEEEHGRPRSNMLPLYITVLARPRQGSMQLKPIREEKNVPFKRKTGMFRRRVIEKLFPKRSWQKD